MADGDIPFQLKHYRLKRTELSGQPALLFEINVDLQDVRSKYRDSYRAFFQAEWLQEVDLAWTADMVCQIQPDLLEQIHPPSEFEWPPWSDEKIIQYLAKHYRPQIWKNHALKIYSNPGESKKEFLLRCQDILFQEWLQEQQKFWDVFVHRFLELEEKLIEELKREEVRDEKSFDRRLEQIRDLFFSVRENLWTFRDGWQPLAVPELQWKSEPPLSVKERLDDLREDLTTVCHEINQRSKQKAEEIEHYEVPVTYPQIEVVSRGIVWSRIFKETERFGNR